MAKKTKKSTSTGDFMRACAYFALIIAAALYLTTGLLNYFDISGFDSVLSALNLVAELCLAIGIAFAAYEFTSGKAVIWRVLFWIALIVYVLGCVFGIL